MLDIYLKMLHKNIIDLLVAVTNINAHVTETYIHDVIDITVGYSL